MRRAFLFGSHQISSLPPFKIQGSKTALERLETKRKMMYERCGAVRFKIDGLMEELMSKVSRFFKE